MVSPHAVSPHLSRRCRAMPTRWARSGVWAPCWTVYRGDTGMTSHAEILAKLRSSALGAATVRAFAALEADARIRKPDYIAREFLDAAVRPALGDSQKVAAFRTQLESILPGAYHFQNARTLHIDARLEKAIGDGCTQVVMLGAGFDSRAYRFGAQHKNVRFFEVDLPALQQEKKSKIAEFLGPPPDNVEYVALDFNTQTLQELLDMPAYDAALPTFFNWEGVSYYLTAAGVDATLAFVRVSAPGSRLLFDFMPRAMIDGRRLLRRRTIAQLHGQVWRAAVVRH